jgi:hypothetical protein
MAGIVAALALLVTARPGKVSTLLLILATAIGLLGSAGGPAPAALGLLVAAGGWLFSGSTTTPTAASSGPAVAAGEGVR